MKLEVGKKYIRRDGGIVTIVDINDGYYRSDTGNWYAKDGRYDGMNEGLLDLVEEFEPKKSEKVKELLPESQMLTKREQIATMTLCGLLSDRDSIKYETLETLVGNAIIYADELIKQLKKTEN